jgi:hypothetical protein
MPEDMADISWTKNNLAQFRTWFFLSKLGQTKAVFEDAAGVKMSKLKFWNAVASADARRIKAGAFASAMDGYFREKLGASFEKGYSWGKAVDEIAGVFSSGDRTIHALSAAVDAAYDFVGEPEEEPIV